MKSRIFILRSFVAGTVLALLLGACAQDEIDPVSAVGQPVNFDAYTSPDAPGTKTVYSGVLDGANYERINWESDDRIRVMSGQVSWPTTAEPAYNYYLQPEHTDGKLGFASLNPHGSAHGLLWGTGSHTFYAMYPAPTNSETGMSLDGYGALVWVTIPEDQSSSTPHTLEGGGTYYGNMNLAYMVAANKFDEPTTDRVVLAFFPIVTTFYVTINNTTGAGMTLRRVELSSTSSQMRGTYTLRMSNVNALTEGALQATTDKNFTRIYTVDGHTSLNESIYANFDGLFVAAGRSVTVALFAVPDPSEPITNVTLSVTTDEEGTVSRLLTEGSPTVTSVFAAEKKHNIVNINVPGADYAIHVEEGPTTISYDQTGVAGPAQTFHVTSTKTVTGNSSAAPWKTQIKLYNTGNELVDWVDMTDANRPSWLVNYPLTSDGVAGIPTSGANVGKAEICRNVTAPPVQTHIEHLKAGVIYDTDGVTPVDNSSSTNAVDLSYYDFVNHRMESTRYTANTYIISAPGWYKFPLVYGNAIENNTDPVADSYNGVHSLINLGHLETFKKAAYYATYEVMNNSWLESSHYAGGAQIVWEQFTHWENHIAVTNGINLRSTSASDPYHVITNLAVVTESSKPYIRFYVNPTNIMPGNVLISSLGSLNGLSGTNNVTWNWQIWITDQNMSPVNVVNATNNYDVMPINLGWIDTAEGLYSPPSSAVIRFVNMSGGIARCTSDAVTIRQSDRDAVSVTGWQPYYQWGRKEPFIPGLFTVEGDDQEIKDVIRNPYTLYQDEILSSGYYDWSQNNYDNLWDSKWDEYGTMGTALPNHKTVYDPSPRKYCVPPENAWETFGDTGSFTGGYFFDTGHGTTIFFPASGYIYYDGTNSTETATGYYWTCHAIGTTSTRTSYALRFSDGAVYPPANYNDHFRANAYSIRPVRYQ